MTMRMLIDARHQEETRVAVVKGNRIEEFDFESAEHKQLKGNIYLAKVTRVEPSLQAAFVDYGGNRHGFLAFSEIHPDYYQIPKEDREALLREEAEHAAEEERLRAAEDAHYDDHDDDVIEGEVVETESEEEGDEGEEGEESDGTPRAKPEQASGSEENAADELRRKRQNLRRRYKIQDVIRRRQVLLVQVVKEERGNKGAALTTYLSLAGRYCVLMPNTSHGGGISRKISNGADRKRLKAIMADLNLPKTMGCIVRTAGLSRTKTEIKRDFDYLARLWDEIRENTLKSAAPALIYGDSDLIKRAIRDIYNREIDEVIVEGEEGYRAARSFMKLLMPSHVRRVQHYADPVPLFQRYGVEDQLSGMYHPLVQLKSGGYLVINPTEALVSIDINSGRSTREHNIEQTAYATNIEAAHEIARQLRLRDMAGLVVIDFIDMESNGHIRKVEKAMKDALKNDRARIQVGRISSFGLMEMSRQRLRTGVLEASTKPCPHCEGTGLMRTASSAGLSALRMLEEEAARGRGSRIILRAGREAAVYVLNKKRHEIAEVEARYGVIVEVHIDESLEGAKMSVESVGPRPVERPRFEPKPIVEEDFDDEILEEEEDEEEEEAPPEEVREERRPRESQRSEEGEGDRGRKRRRRRGRRGGRRREGEPHEGEDSEQVVGEEGAAEAEDQAAPAEAEAEAPATAGEQDDEKPRRGRRRPRARKQGDEGTEAVESVVDAAPVAVEAAAEASVEEPAAEAPAKPKRSRRKKAEPAAETAEAAEPVEAAPAPAAANDAAEAPAEKPKRRSRAKKVVAEAPAEAPAAETPAAAPVPASAPEAPVLERQVAAEGNGADASAEAEDGGPPRRGWWQRTFGG
ncbi:ribonuclease E/G [Sphingosinicella sp. LY1275]|uniref:Rne/Rng family ribonuclease n=1 Tax=Sphingosinicella sp. LY1275 TaxID=3095379 RepID=UPI002ADEDA7E|nr:ribonuclease E/G [Sphingosinicella sp. LY1275]MEA1015452.1 ribonuclease E/G [Sphingosinicella sp. LY1275]